MLDQTNRKERDDIRAKIEARIECTISELELAFKEQYDSIGTHRWWRARLAYARAETKEERLDVAMLLHQSFDEEGRVLMIDHTLGELRV